VKKKTISRSKYYRICRLILKQSPTYNATFEVFPDHSEDLAMNLTKVYYQGFWYHLEKVVDKKSWKVVSAKFYRSLESEKENYQQV